MIILIYKLKEFIEYLFIENNKEDYYDYDPLTPPTDIV